mgnify:CR=1 FL=1
MHRVAPGFRRAGSVPGADFGAGDRRTLRGTIGWVGFMSEGPAKVPEVDRSPVTFAKTNHSGRIPHSESFTGSYFGIRLQRSSPRKMQRYKRVTARLEVKVATCQGSLATLQLGHLNIILNTEGRMLATCQTARLP